MCFFFFFYNYIIASGFNEVLVGNQKENFSKSKFNINYDPTGGQTLMSRQVTIVL